MALANIFFSGMTVFVRLAANEASWSLVVAMRAWVGVLVTLGVAWVSQRSLRINNPAGAWARSLFGCCGMACSFYAMGSSDISLGDVATLRATAPIFIALLAAFYLQERLTFLLFVALAISLLGVVILVEPTFTSSSRLAALTMLGAMFSSIAMLYLRRIGPYESAEAVATHFGLVSSLLFSTLAFTQWEKPHVLGVVYGFFAGAAGGLGQLCMTRAYAKEKAAVVSAMGYLSVLLTHLAAAVVLGEPLGGRGLLGGVLVIGGGLVLVLGPSAVRRISRREE